MVSVEEIECNVNTFYISLRLDDLEGDVSEQKYIIFRNPNIKNTLTSQKSTCKVHGALCL